MNLPIELFKKKEHLYAFFNHMTEMVVITNAKDGTIVYINKSLSDTFLYSKDKLIGKKYDIFWLGMIDSDIYKSVKSKIDLDGHYEGSYINIIKDGSHCSLDVKGKNASILKSGIFNQ